MKINNCVEAAFTTLLEFQQNVSKLLVFKLQNTQAETIRSRVMITEETYGSIRVLAVLMTPQKSSNLSSAQSFNI